jgi:hypothetical protein
MKVTRKRKGMRIQMTRMG